MVKSIVLPILIFGFAALVSSACDFTRFACNSAGLSCPSPVGLSVGSVNYGLANLDVISFNDLTINHGDIQGRAAIRNNFYGLNGISVGDILTDGLGYSLIAGGDANIADDGQVYPAGMPFFVGGSLSVPSYVNTSDVSTCATLGGSSGCLSSRFDTVYNYFTQFASTLNNQADNVAVSFQSSHAVFTCSAASGNYFVHMSGSDLSQVTSYCVVGCSANANWFITVTGDAILQGNALQVSGLVLFNFLSGSITVSTSIYANILAPNSNLVMNGGTIYGTVVIGNSSNIVQINQASCSGSSVSGLVAAKRSDSFCDSLTGTPSATSTSAAADASTSTSSSGDANASSSTSADASASTSTSSSASGDASNVGNANGSDNTGSDSGASSMAVSFVLATIALVMLI